jgi:hypothetical protein
MSDKGSCRPPMVGFKTSGARDDCPGLCLFRPSLGPLSTTRHIACRDLDGSYIPMLLRMTAVFVLFGLLGADNGLAQRANRLAAAVECRFV